MNSSCDILIVGGGPAGAAAGALLAAAGRDVIICEGKAFPRPKVCGEFMSPRSRPVLARLGLLKWFDENAGPEITRLVALSASGPPLESALPAGVDDAPARTMRRDILDTALLSRAGELGARIAQPAHVFDVAGSAADGFLARTSAGAISARTLILAHGSPRRGAMLPESGAGTPTGFSSGYLCFKTYFSSVSLPKNTIAIGGAAGLYFGLVYTNAPQATLAFAAAPARVAKIGPDPAVHLRLLQNEIPSLARLLGDAKPDSPWLATGPLSPGVRTLYDDGRFFVGNAAGEVHALIGEGITLALTGGALLADALLAHPSSAAAGKIYERAWRTEFSLRYHAANFFTAIFTRPALSHFVTGLMDRQRELFHACVTSSANW